jgi:di/tripeptidase
MVCEKNLDTPHDFSKDPIRLLLDGSWIRADGTTLGADNGIGVAAMLAVMEDPDLIHPDLDLIFTAEEETGLTGAYQLSRASSEHLHSSTSIRKKTVPFTSGVQAAWIPSLSMN